jgi:3-methylfumaryl-CoA hydratase
VTHDHITPSAFNLFSNTLPTSSPTFPAANALLPPGWHHIYFPPRTPEADLATDGYEQEFFPPGYSQRMWAGAQYSFSPDNPLRVGDYVTMKTYMDSIDINTAQATVWINKEISNKSGWSMTEKRCMVYHPHQRQMEQRGIRGKRNIGNI